MPNRALALATALLVLLPATAAAATPRVTYTLDVAGPTARATTTFVGASGRTTSVTRRVPVGRCTSIGRDLPTGAVAAGSVQVRWSAVRLACGVQGRVASLTLDLLDADVPHGEPGRCFLGALDLARSTRSGAMTLEASGTAGSAVCTAARAG